MVVRLQTADGEVKRFPTTYTEDGGEYGPPGKYITPCGLEWDHAPKELEECDHLDCAINCAKRRKNESRKYFILFVVIAGLFPISKIIVGFPSIFFILMGAYVLIALWFLIDEFRAGKRFKELIEYRDLSTINGIKAFKIGPPVMLQLQTEDGGIRQYQTVYGLGTPIDHLDCGIYLLRNWRRKEMAGYFFAAISVISIAIIAIANTKGLGDLESNSIIILVSFTFLAIYCLTWGHDEKSQLDELNEFKYKGTIKGIKARQIFDDLK